MPPGVGAVAHHAPRRLQHRLLLALRGSHLRRHGIEVMLGAHDTDLRCRDRRCRCRHQRPMGLRTTLQPL